MNSEVRDAIESACTVAVSRPLIYRAEPQRNRSPEAVRAIVLAVARELPPEMTMAELCEELEIANNQVPR